VHPGSRQVGGGGDTSDAGANDDDGPAHDRPSRVDVTGSSARP
jgi:hypothetical protein